jgi:TPR repeat
MASDTIEALGALYSRFILLDLLAKATPGAIVLITIYWTIVKPSHDQITSDISFSVFVIFTFISWIFGFAIQGIGDGCSALIARRNGMGKMQVRSYYYSPYSTALTYRFRNIILKYGESDEKNNFLRLNVLKEACGNGCLAFLFSFILVILDGSFRNNAIYPICYIITILSLFYMHKECLIKEWKYGLDIIKNNESAQSAFGKAWINESKELCKLGKYDEAIKALEEAIELDPKLPEAWHSKGLALKALCRTPEADEAFAKSKELGYMG